MWVISSVKFSAVVNVQEGNFWYAEIYICCVNMLVIKDCSWNWHFFTLLDCRIWFRKNQTRRMLNSNWMIIALCEFPRLWNIFCEEKPESWESQTERDWNGTRYVVAIIARQSSFVLKHQHQIFVVLWNANGGFYFATKMCFQRQLKGVFIVCRLCCCKGRLTDVEQAVGMGGVFSDRWPDYWRCISCSQAAQWRQLLQRYFAGYRADAVRWSRGLWNWRNQQAQRDSTQHQPGLCDLGWL